LLNTLYLCIFSVNHGVAMISGSRMLMAKDTRHHEVSMNRCKAILVAVHSIMSDRTRREAPGIDVCMLGGASLSSIWFI
jgi:hypothetical protein